jgi:hypothetical protein
MGGRRANGEGTIYPRKDGRWEGAVYLLTGSGMRKRLRVYGATRGEVHARLTDAKAKEQQGIPMPDKAWKLGAYLDVTIHVSTRRCCGMRDVARVLW